MTHVNVSKRRQIHLDLCTAGHPSCIFAPQSSSPLKNHWNISKAGTRRSCGRVSLYYSPRGWNFEEERRNKKRGLLLPTCSSPPRNMSESGSFTALLFFFFFNFTGRPLIYAAVLVRMRVSERRRMRSAGAVFRLIKSRMNHRLLNCVSSCQLLI